MRKSPAQVYAAVFGAALVFAGVVGFFYEASFATGTPERDDVFGLFDINGWHNVVHVLSGLVGLALAKSWSGARLYAYGFGAVYLLVTALGFAVGDGGSILGLIPINSADNYLHLVISVLGLLAGLLSPSAPRPTLQGARSRALEMTLPAKGSPR